MSEQTNLGLSNESLTMNSPIELCPINNHGQITAACFLIAFVLSMVGNGLLMCALVRLEDLRKASNLYFLCLASFDLLFTLTLPFWAFYHLHHWVFGDLPCKLLTGAYFVGQYGGVMLLTAMTLDRFCAVVLRGRRKARPGRRILCARAVCVATWVASIGASLRDALNSTVKEQDGEFFCEDLEDTGDNSYAYHIQIVFLFLLPLLIMVFCYSCILRTVLSVPTMKGRRGTVALMVCFVTLFFTCWGPYHLVLLLKTVLDLSDCPAEQCMHLAYVTCRILAYAHCCVNPLLYLLRPRFRALLCRLVRCSECASQPASLLHSQNAARMQKASKSTLDMVLM